MAGHIRDRRIADAFRRVPRHLFLDEGSLTEAYSDVALAILTREGSTISTISQPAMVALMLEQLGVQPGDRVLEIGTGSGYNAALLAELAGPNGTVVSIDIEPELVERARRHLDHAGHNEVRVVCGDGFEGYAADVPYDRITLTVASTDVARAWFEQLAPNGRLVLPLVVHALQQSAAFERRGDELISTSLVGAEFIPLRGSGGHETQTVKIDDGIRIRLRCGEGTAVDPERAALLLHGPSRRREIPAPLVPGEEFDVAFWLDLVRADVCTLRASGDPRRVAALPSVGGDERDGSYTFGIAASDGLVFVDRHAGTTVLRTYGTSDGPANALADGIAAWDRAGRPRVEEVRLVVRFDGGAHENAGVVLRRENATISVLLGAA